MDSLVIFLYLTGIRRDMYYVDTPTLEVAEAEVPIPLLPTFVKWMMKGELTSV